MDIGDEQVGVRISRQRLEPRLLQCMMEEGWTIPGTRSMQRSEPSIRTPRNGAWGASTYGSACLWLRYGSLARSALTTS